MALGFDFKGFVVVFRFYGWMGTTRTAVKITLSCADTFFLIMAIVWSFTFATSNSQYLYLTLLGHTTITEL